VSATRIRVRPYIQIYSLSYVQFLSRLVLPLFDDYWRIYRNTFHANDVKFYSLPCAELVLEIGTKLITLETMVVYFISKTSGNSFIPNYAADLRHVSVCHRYTNCFKLYVEFSPFYILYRPLLYEM
jgi:hypothetical protein